MRIRGRLLVGASVAWAWVGALDTVPGPVRIGDATCLGFPLAWLVSVPVLGLATVLVFGLVARFVRAPRPELPVLLGLFALYLGVARLEALDALGEVAIGHGKFLPGAVLLALAVGGVGGRDDPDGGWARGVDLAAGVPAALYAWAGIVKVLEGGAVWGRAANVSMLAYERSLADPGVFAPLQAWVAARPALGVAMAEVVLAIELAGVCFLVPALRVPYAVVVTAMHLGIGLLIGYAYTEWILAVWGLALWTVDTASVDAARVGASSADAPTASTASPG